MANVVLYTKTYCPYSKECKKFLDDLKVDYEEITIDNNPAAHQEMITKTNNREDTPQVFVNGHHIGSFDDLKAVKAKGELEDLLDLN